MTQLKTKWELEKLFDVDGVHDPRIKRDINKLKRALTAFAKKYDGTTDYLRSPKKLKEALDAQSRFEDHGLRYMYIVFRNYLDSNDTEVIAIMSKYDQELRPYYSKVLFFDLALGAIPLATQRKLLTSPLLADYRYDLYQVFENAKYNLSQKEEELLNLLGPSSGGMWIDGVRKLRNKQMIDYGKSQIPLSEALMRYSSLPTRERRTMWNNIIQTLKDNTADFAESEINALFTKKKVLDERRGLKKPYSATVIGYENTEKSVETLVNTVTDAFPVAHKFYRIKKKMSGLSELQYADRGMDIGKVQTTFNFKEAYEIVYKAFQQFDQEYADILERMVMNGQVDVLPQKGKSGGAFCANLGNGPTMVLLNHTGDFRSVMTFAHEMGHAIHSELSKCQPPHYRDYSTAVAETASTLFEQVVFDYVFERLTDAEKIIALHDMLGDRVATIFRQIACFNFEKELHERIRSEGFVSKENIAALLNDHMQSYVGKAVTMCDDDGYFFTAWSHIRRPFYVYSYAYGDIISAALYERYRNDNNFKKNIRTFLSAGSSMSPDDIFNMIGVDTTKPTFFKSGIDSIARDLRKLERLVQK